MKNIVIFCILVFIISLSYAKNRLVYYEPVVTKLTGVVKVKTYPGPPNYESVENGDVAETCPYLILDKPIDVDLPPHIKTNENEIDEPVVNIKVVQLAVINNSELSKLKEGSRVIVTGTLFYWFTGHHHTKVLMAVKKTQKLIT